MSKHMVADYSLLHSRHRYCPQFRVSRCRRVCLFSYNAADDTIDWRHYYISYSDSVKQKRIEDLTENDIGSEVIDEAEESSDGKKSSKKGKKAARKGVNLREIGPRLTLKLHKIYDGVNSGEVLYHSEVTKSPEEILKLRQKHETRRALKERRKQQQQENVERKEAERQKKAEEKEMRKLRAQKEMERKVLGVAQDEDDDDSDGEHPVGEKRRRNDPSDDSNRSSSGNREKKRRRKKGKK